MQLVVTLLVGWGIGWCVARSEIMEPLRSFLAGWKARLEADLPAKVAAGGVPGMGDVLAAAVVPFLSGVTHCAACFGFWTGLALGAWRPVAGDGLAGALATGISVMGVNATLVALVGAAAAHEQEAWAQAASAEAQLEFYKKKYPLSSLPDDKEA